MTGEPLPPAVTTDETFAVICGADRDRHRLTLTGSAVLDALDTGRRSPRSIRVPAVVA